MQLGLDSDKDASEQNVAKVQQREAEMGDVIQVNGCATLMTSYRLIDHLTPSILSLSLTRQGY